MKKKEQMLSFCFNTIEKCSVPQKTQGTKKWEACRQGSTVLGLGQEAHHVPNCPVKLPGLAGVGTEEWVQEPEVQSAVWGESKQQR